MDETADDKVIAMAVKGAVVIDYLYDLARVGYAEVKITGWDEVKALAPVLDIRGRLYGYSGWNSDKMVAYFRTDRIIGRT